MVEDPRFQRRSIEVVPWHRDPAILVPYLGIVGFAAAVFGVLFADTALAFANGVDLEARYGRCAPDSVNLCATVVNATVLAVDGSGITLDESGTRFTVVGAAGAPASDFRRGEVVETVSAGGPVAELKAGGTLLFTRYYPKQDPHYWQWQGAVFAALALLWLPVYLWGIRMAALRSPLAVLRRR